MQIKQVLSSRQGAYSWQVSYYISMELGYKVENCFNYAPPAKVFEKVFLIKARRAQEILLGYWKEITLRTLNCQRPNQ